MLVVALVLLIGSAPPASARDVRVGVYANPPKIMLDANGQPSGILGELLTQIAEDEHWTLQPVACEWQECLRALRAGELDLLPDLAYTEERANEFALHRLPALHSWSQLYARQGIEITSMVDIDGRRVALLSGSVQQDYLVALANGFGLRVQWLPYPSMDAALDAVADGRADAVATNRHFGDWVAERRGLQHTPVIFMPARLFYASTQGRNQDLLDAIDSHLQRWQSSSDSTFYAVLRRWGAPEASVGLPKYVLWSAAGALALLLLSLAVVALLRREVGRRTRSLRASEERLATILNSVDAHIFIKDRELRYRYVNQKVCALFGLPAEQILGRGDGEFFDDATAAQLRNNDRQVIDGGQRLACEETNRARGGGPERSFFSIKLPLHDADGRINALCGISTDITEQHQLLGEIHQLAYFDPLTHLPNRQQLFDQLRESLAACAVGVQQGALLLLNLDRFHELNDTRGHDVGDQWLQLIAQRVRPYLHEGQSVARLGADEFGFLMAQLPPSATEGQRQASALAQSLLDSVLLPCQLAGVAYHGSCSIGVTLFADPTASVQDVLKRADIALSQAKIAGGNRIRFFQPEMQEAIAARAALEADLREGMAAGQLLLYYQPQVDIRGHLFGVEALVRWQHPQRGLVPPASFIPLAEACGLIVPLGHWVLRQACMQLCAWRGSSETRDLRIAVNVSAHQLHRAEFVDEVLEVLRSTGADAGRLEIEITESHLVEDIDSAIGKLGALRAHGVRIALDDFGTGYSALNYIKRLPLDVLKIDTSFVRDLLLDANDMAIVKTIIALGHSLKLEVLAEGVEDAAQRDVLGELGCGQFQGYLFGRPVAIDELAGRWAVPSP